MLNLSVLFNNNNEERPAFLDALTLDSYQKSYLKVLVKRFASV